MKKNKSILNRTETHLRNRWKAVRRSRMMVGAVKAQHRVFDLERKERFMIEKLDAQTRLEKSRFLDFF